MNQTEFDFFKILLGKLKMLNIVPSRQNVIKRAKHQVLGYPFNFGHTAARFLPVLLMNKFFVYKVVSFYMIEKVEKLEMIQRNKILSHLLLLCFS